MNSLLSSSVVRNSLLKVYQVRNYTRKTPLKLKDRINYRRLTKFIKKERREYEKKLEESFLPPTQKIEFGLQTLAARGFLRNTKPYTPPENLNDKILNIAKNATGITDENELLNINLTDPVTRFNFLQNCVTELNHDIPNSQLHKMMTVSAVIDYYQLPVSTVNSYDKMCNNPQSLPPNLHLQKEPLRFNPETDTMFGGISAFPESSTIVSGLKAKKKYKGFDGRPDSHKLY